MIPFFGTPDRASFPTPKTPDRAFPSSQKTDRAFPIPKTPIALPSHLLSPYHPISPSPHLLISPSPHLPITPSPHLRGISGE
ncbi:hypothetical protein FRE64_12815 [Euhalothece natronophila Z-M001]|uniref:Uncharacterized protein n=1 Tax=Euhalothece natronophila Z-M001 TaxID=522448 RepID=A0A5B8NRP5_9CHRO|nr:hypothetical protein [Euhalothece natronophila]QDZ40750.1 hypothetical protein FRE64_12815 [Euhalothece natronophila Z-M001]